MFGLESNQTDLKSVDKRIDEVESNINQMERELQELLDEVGVTAEAVSEYNHNPDNYNPEDFQRLQEMRETLDKALERSLTNIRNPKKAASTYKSQQSVDNNWLFIR